MASTSTLTVKKVAKLLRQGKKGRHLDGGPGGVRGLYLEIESKTNAHYLLRFQLNHRTRWMGLGSARTFALPEARTRAKVERQKLADRIDPLAIRRAERAKAAAAPETLTFAKAAQAYFDQHEAKWTNAKHRDAFLSTLKQYAFPRIGALDVAEIGTPHVLAVLEQKTAAHKGNPAGVFWQVRTTTASRVRNRIELVLDWAAVRGYRPSGAPNPARWQGHLSEVLPAPGQIAKIAHHRAVPYAEMPSLVGVLRQREGVAAQALVFTILVVARAGETLGATWPEIGFEAAVWTVPAERMKSRRPHRVPLAPQVIELLDGLHREDGNPFLFIGSKPGAGLSETSLAATLRRVGRSETVHGLRSSFSDWAHERTGHASHEIELSLAHSVGSDQEKAYRRGDMLDKRRKLMEAWARYCTSPPPAGALVPLRGAR
jgi:integrase